jgi:hypothetical protein
MAEEYQYSKIRNKFGRHPQFEEPTDGIKIAGVIAPNPSKATQYVLRNPNKLVLDNIPQLSEHRVS